MFVCEQYLAYCGNLNLTAHLLVGTWLSLCGLDAGPQELSKFNMVRLGLGEG